MLVVFGSLNADLIFSLPELPVAGQTLLAETMTVEPGGKGGNQAAAAALDGATVMMVGAVGRDAMAEVALGGLREAGIDLSRVAAAEQPTGCASIVTDRDGRNQIVLATGANRTARAEAVDDALLGPETILVTQMETDAEQTAALIRRARRRDARIVHNLAPAAALAADALRMLDVLVVNEDEAAWLARHEGAAGDDAALLHAALGITVVRTLGGAGVEWADAEGGGRIEAAPVKVVDTTAAGDCFVGVLAAALDRGFSLREALHRANVAAGLACTSAGSQGSLPSRQHIDAAMAERSAKP
jgi:ribokinase